MILKTVLNDISNLPDIPFSQFYIKYIMDIQDNNLDAEVRRIGMGASVLQVDELLSDIYEGVKDMISSVDIQNAYVKLYEQLRKYIWAAEIVEKLADLEVSVYEVFPNMEEVRKNFKYLKPELYETMREDEEFKEAVDEFEDVIKEDVGYGRLEKVQEVV